MSLDEKRSIWDRLIYGAALVFGLAAPWSIALAQTGIVSLALFAIARRLSRRSAPPPWPWTLIAVAAYLVVQALSIPLGIHPGHSLSCYRGSWVLLFPFVFWDVLQDARVRRTASVALLVSGTLAAAYGVLQYVQGVDWLHDRETLERVGNGYMAVGNLSSHLTYAGVQLPIFFLAIGTALATCGRRRAIAGLAAAVLGASVLLSFTRSAWVGAAAGVAFVVIGLGWRRAAVVVGALVILVGGVALSDSALVSRFTSILDVTDRPRWRLWQTALRILAEHPVLGAGLGSFPALFPVYKVAGVYKSTIHPHSDVLNAAVETGLVGASVWIGIWVAFFRESRVVRALGARAWIPRGIAAGVFALLVAGLGQCYSTDEEVAQVWFFLMIVALVESGLDTEGGRAPLKRLRRKAKAWSLPLARRLFARRGEVPATSPSPGPPTASRRSSWPGDLAGPGSVLVVRPDDRLGNLILMTPFLARLRDALPGARIGMLVGSVYAPLLRAWPWVDTLIVQDKRAHIRAPWTFGTWLAGIRSARWDVAFEMSNHNTHSYYSCLLALASGASERVGFDEPRNQDVLTRPVPAPDATMHFSLTPLTLLGSMGWPAEPLAISCPLADGDDGATPAMSPPLDGPYVIVHVGGRGTKSLDDEAWSAFLDAATNLFDGTIVLIAGPGERDRLRFLRAMASEAGSDGDRVRVAPPLEPVALARLIRGAACYVGCDTGVMHLAVALGTPTAALFFRSNPYHYAPLGRQHATVLLANPYGVEPEIWKGASALDRSRLVIAHGDSPRSAAGVPETGARANAAMLDAFSFTLSSGTGTLDVRT